MKALKNLKRPSRLSVFSGIAAVFLALMMQSGGSAMAGIMGYSALSFVIGFLLYFALFFFLIRKLFLFLDRKPKARAKKQSFVNKFSVKYFFIFFGIILLCWLPIFLAYYPGAFGYDVEYQMTDLDTFDGHHPLIHNIFLRGTVAIGYKLFGPNNLAIAFSTVIQMIIIGGAFAYICEAFRHFGKKYLHYGAALFFGLMPFCSYMAISHTKDAMFIAFFAMSLMMIFEALVIEKISAKRIIGTSFIFMLTALFRNNAPYIVVAWLIIASIMLWRYQAKRVLLYACAGGLVLAGVFHIVGTRVFSTTGETELSAPYSVPLHLMAATIAFHPELLDEEKLEDGKVFGYFDKENVEAGAYYCPILADCAKHTLGLQITNENKMQMLLTTAKVGLSHPADYLKSYIYLMKSSWYPFSYDYYKIYGTVNPAGEEEAGFREGITRPTIMAPYVTHQPLLPHLRAFLDKEWFNLGYSGNLITNTIMVPATYVHGLVIIICYAWYSRRKKLLLMTMLPLMAYGTILIGPCVLIRYMAPVMVAVPMLYAYTFVYKDSLLEK